MDGWNGRKADDVWRESERYSLRRMTLPQPLVPVPVRWVVTHACLLAWSNGAPATPHRRPAPGSDSPAPPPNPMHSFASPECGRWTGALGGRAMACWWRGTPATTSSCLPLPACMGAWWPTPTRSSGPGATPMRRAPSSRCRCPGRVRCVPGGVPGCRSRGPRGRTLSARRVAWYPRGAWGTLGRDPGS